ncbi:CAAX protease self-immunity [Halomicrobium zhouii]|uniref:CAAX protease self-immunity n=1 Tax=Halomicrobium zhouii TaxID=767519 RepID=A0A1I6K508_9EURY|nr:CPBP family intramembrane glutamic endopeptidase [Halomicrobium zhouii]SFR86355.1 CAAX protease self-immunity [Halomicrobium zhouii]
MPDITTPTTDRLAASSDRTLVAFGSAAILVWVALEFAFRRGLGPVVAEALGTPGAGDPLMLALAFPLIAGFIAWWGTRVGIHRPNWAYETSLRTVGAGVGGLVVYFVLYLAALLALVAVGSVAIPPEAAQSTGFRTGLPTWVLVAFLLGNGIVVPITEELAWRGVIQTALTESYGTYAAVVVTALAFAGKHLVVDLAAPPARVASLVVLAFVLCGLRARWGTTASTVTHLLANFLATASLVAL